MKIKRIATAAKEKGCSRTTVYVSIAYGKIDSVLIDGTPYIEDNKKYKDWIAEELSASEKSEV